METSKHGSQIQNITEQHLKDAYGPVYSFLYQTPTESIQELNRRKKNLIRYLTKYPMQVYRTNNPNTIHAFNKSFQKYKDRIYRPEIVEEFENKSRDIAIRKGGLMTKNVALKILNNLSFDEVERLYHTDKVMRNLMAETNFWQDKLDQLNEGQFETAKKKKPIDYRNVLGIDSIVLTVLTITRMRTFIHGLYDFYHYWKTWKRIRRYYNASYMSVGDDYRYENNPKIISKALPYLVNLESLKYNTSTIGDFKDNFSCWSSNLKKLEIVGRISVKSLPGKLFQNLPHLESLTITRNNFYRTPGRRFVSLPVDLFYGLDNLKYLDISNNRITKLPQGIFSELVNLVELDISNNELTRLSKDL